MKALEGHSETVEYAKFSFDGKLLATGGMNNAIRVWSTEGEEFQLKHAITDGAVQSDINFLEWHPKGNVFITGGQDYLIWLYNGVNGAMLQCLVGHEDQVLCAKFTVADGGKNIVSSSADKTIRLWNPMQNQCLKVIRNSSLHGVSGKFHEADINCFALHHERPLVVSGDLEGQVFYSHYLTGETGSLLGSHINNVESIVFSRHTPICVSAGIDPLINVYDLN